MINEIYTVASPEQLQIFAMLLIQQQQVMSYLIIWFVTISNYYFK